MNESIGMMLNCTEHCISFYDNWNSLNIGYNICNNLEFTQSPIPYINNNYVCLCPNRQKYDHDLDHLGIFRIQIWIIED